MLDIKDLPIAALPMGEIDPTQAIRLRAVDWVREQVQDTIKLQDVVLADNDEGWRWFRSDDTVLLQSIADVDVLTNRWWYGFLVGFDAGGRFWELGVWVMFREEFSFK